MNQHLQTIYTGTSGLVLPVPNKEAYPPAFRNKSRLCFYASLFNSIEINSSFYKVPMARTVERWAQEVPNGFRFTFKLWRDITHNKGLLYEPAAVARFLHVIAQAGNKMGCLLIQFPPGLQVGAAPQLQNLLAVIRADEYARNWDVAVEFRHRSWNADRIYKLLDAYNAGLVLHDKGDSAPPMMTLGAGFVYLRFHGPEGNYRGSYADDFIYEYAQYIREWQQEGKRVYVYFNNTMGNAVHNLLKLNTYLEES